MSKVAEGDYYNIRQSGTVLAGVKIFDDSQIQTAHRDGIQIIPQSDRNSRWQYIGGMITDIVMYENSIIALDSSLQGIFMGDGCMRRGVFIQNFILNKNSHEISLSGLLSGHFDDNFLMETDGTIELCPMRIGGGKFGEIYIMSFADEDMEYELCTGSDVKSERFNDLRFTRKKGAKHLYNFRYKEWIDYIAPKTKRIRNLDTFIKTVQGESLKFGDLK